MRFSVTRDGNRWPMVVVVVMVAVTMIVRMIMAVLVIVLVGRDDGLTHWGTDCLC